LKEGIFELKWRNQKDVAKIPLAKAGARLAAEVTRGPTAQPR